MNFNQDEHFEEVQVNGRDQVNSTNSQLQKARWQRQTIKLMRAGHVPGPIPALSYRADFFGRQFNELVLFHLLYD